MEALEMEDAEHICRLSLQKLKKLQYKNEKYLRELLFVYNTLQKVGNTLNQSEIPECPDLQNLSTPSPIIHSIQDCEKPIFSLS